jgi:hypothetical protein
MHPRHRFCVKRVPVRIHFFHPSLLQWFFPTHFPRVTHVKFIAVDVFVHRPPHWQYALLLGMVPSAGLCRRKCRRQRSRTPFRPGRCVPRDFSRDTVAVKFITLGVKIILPPFRQFSFCSGMPGMVCGCWLHRIAVVGKTTFGTHLNCDRVGWSFGFFLLGWFFGCATAATTPQVQKSQTTTPNHCSNQQHHDHDPQIQSHHAIATVACCAGRWSIKHVRGTITGLTIWTDARCGCVWIYARTWKTGKEDDRVKTKILNGVLGVCGGCVLFC